MLRYFYDLQFKKEGAGATKTAGKAAKTKQSAKDAAKAFPHRKFVELNSKICSDIQELENLEANFQGKYRDTLVNVLNFYLGTCGLEKKQPKYFKALLKQIQSRNYEIIKGSINSPQPLEDAIIENFAEKIKTKSPGNPIQFEAKKLESIESLLILVGETILDLTRLGETN